jgi:protein-tyrosine phosphatase
MRILFVCLGNICRSPTAEGIFRDKVRKLNLEKKISIDSAGTGGWHVGQAPDLRSQACAEKFGIDLSDLRARQTRVGDFSFFDLILAMDKSNFEDLKRLAPKPELLSKLKLMLDFHPTKKSQNVPDPYQGGPEGFEHVFKMLDAACDELLKFVQREIEKSEKPDGMS